MKYQNLSRTTREIHGVTLKPFEIKEILGVVNDNNLIRIHENEKKVQKPASTPKPKPVSTKQELPEPPVIENNNQEVNETDG